MNRKWVAVAFGDIVGFGVWRRRAATTNEISVPFIQKFYGHIEEFVLRQHTLNHIKYLGDGLMVICEIPETSEAAEHLAAFIMDLGKLNSKLRKAVHECPYPAPDGFRMRLVCGHVDKLSVVDPTDTKRKVPEFIGYDVNLAQRLLEVAPTTPFICHESAVKILKKKTNGFRLRRLVDTPERPRGVDSEDIEGLWVVEF